MSASSAGGRTGFREVAARIVDQHGVDLRLRDARVAETRDDGFQLVERFCLEGRALEVEIDDVLVATVVRAEAAEMAETAPPAAAAAPAGLTIGSPGATSIAPAPSVSYAAGRVGG